MPTLQSCNDTAASAEQQRHTNPTLCSSLNKEQKEFYDWIRERVTTEKFDPFHVLLHGLPGSGKTYTMKVVVEMFNTLKIVAHAAAYMWSAVFQLDVNCQKKILSYYRKQCG